jgi:hypothetical protein
VQNAERRDKMTAMEALKAHVRNGHVVVNEPTELPEGTEVAVTKIVGPFAGMDPMNAPSSSKSSKRGIAISRTASTLMPESS